MSITPPPTASTGAPDSTGSAATAADTAYTAYLQVTRTYLDPAICRDVRDQFGTAVLDGTTAAAHRIAADYRTTLYTADAGIRAVPFPAAVRPDANGLLQADKDEIASLDAFASLSADKMLLPYLKIMTEDDVRAARADAIGDDLGHPVADDLLAVRSYDDGVRLALATLEGSFVQLDSYSADLVRQEGAAMVDGQYVVTFQHALSRIPVSPPSQARSDADRLAAASRALVTELSTDAHAADSGAAGRVKARYGALVRAAGTLDTQLGSDMTAASAPDRGCTGTTGEVTPSSGQADGSSATGAVTTSTSTLGGATTLVTEVAGTGWAAMLPVGWTVGQAASGDDLDATAPDGARLSVISPTKTNADAATAGTQASDGLAAKGYRIDGRVTVDTWAGWPCFFLGATTPGGTVDIDIRGVVHHGALTVISLVVPHGASDASRVLHVLSALESTWRWS